MNGSYRFSTNGAAAGPLLFTANLASGDPVAPSGANYYSTVTGTIMNGPGMDLTDCNGQAIPLTGKITNPDHNNVYINMTGPTAGGGTMMMDGTLGIYIQGNMDSTLGSTFGGTIRIDGGSCPMSSTDYVAQH